MLDNKYPEEEVAPGQPVAQTLVRDCLVSTVRLPVPSPVSGYEYETMIRSGDDWLDYQTRCKTLERDDEWILHGHTHTKVRRWGERHIHCGVDAWDYSPIALDAILRLAR